VRRRPNPRRRNTPLPDARKIKAVRKDHSDKAIEREPGWFPKANCPDCECGGQLCPEHGTGLLNDHRRRADDE
jgi:hypothetical protein